MNDRQRTRDYTLVVLCVGLIMFAVGSYALQTGVAFVGLFDACVASFLLGWLGEKK